MGNGFNDHATNFTHSRLIFVSTDFTIVSLRGDLSFKSGKGFWKGKSYYSKSGGRSCTANRTCDAVDLIPFLSFHQPANGLGAVIVLDSILVASGLALAVPTCENIGAQESSEEDGGEFKLHSCCWRLCLWDGWW